MQRFDLWVGQWRGSGWSVDPAGRRTEFDQVEEVQSRVGGAVLLIEGRSTSKADSMVVTHDGLVVVSFDEQTGKYLWRGHELGRRPMEAEVEVMGGGLRWTLGVPQSKAAVRFTIQFDHSQWHEIGEVSPDGLRWSRFMEMKLQRVTAAAP